jgi:hypothetical protein
MNRIIANRISRGVMVARPCCLWCGILFKKTAFLGLRVRDSFSKIAEEISKTRPRLWYNDRWLQFCRNNTIFGLLKYSRSANEIDGEWFSAFVSRSLVKIL